MLVKFRIFSTPSFDRQVKKLFNKNKKIVNIYESVLNILQKSPSVGKNIKKLTDIKQGRGQWRIRSRNYRFRYDIFGKKVILHSAKDRGDAY